MDTFDDIALLFETSPLMQLVTLFFVINTSIPFIEMLIDLYNLKVKKGEAHNKSRQWKDTFANVSIFLFSQAVEATVFGSIAIICLYPIYILTPFEISSNGWSWFGSLVLADFTYYWMHRIEHEHRILWANHSVHHSSTDYNLSISFRLSVVEGAIEWIFLIPMILIGFDLFQAILSLILVVQYQTWIHTENIGKLGWFDHVFNSPSVHRVHHGSNPQYINKNYGGVLMVWDKLFDTYQEENEQVIYGLTKNINTNNPIKINFLEYRKIYQDVKRCPKVRGKLKIIFGALN